MNELPPPCLDPNAPKHCVFDLKTTSQLSGQWIEGQRINPAYLGYVIGAQISGVPNVVGTYVAGLQLAKLPQSDRCRKHGVPKDECRAEHVTSQIFLIEYTQYKLDQWLAEAKHWADRIRRTITKFPEMRQIHKVRQQGRRLGKCSEYDGCSYQQYCLGDRQEKWLEMFAYRPYQPYEPEEADGVLRMSNSMISSFAGCSTRGMLRYKHHLDRKKEPAFLMAGTSCHLACELHLNREPIEKCLAAFDESYRDYSLEAQLVPGEDRLEYSNVRAILEIFLHKHPLHLLPFKPVAGMQEIAFEFPLLPAKGNLPPVNYCGRIDGIVEF